MLQNLKITQALTLCLVLATLPACLLQIDTNKRNSTSTDTLGAANPKLYASSTFSLGFRGNRLIQSSHLQISDPDNSASEITYGLVSVPSTGTLYKNTTALVVSDTFTQADIDNGLISFLHTGAYAASDSFAYSATSLGGGPAVTGSFTISFSATLSYTRVRSIYKINTAITALSPSALGFTPTSYSVDVALPAGLSLNTTSGVISGTPTGVTAAANYTITATDGTNSATHVINIRVMDGFVVNNNGDGTDATPGDTVCETVLGNGVCTLRAAIGEVVGGAGNMVILFDAAITSVTIGSALPNITASVAIVGNGRDTTQIDCNNGAYRALATTGAPAKTLTVSDITIRRCAPAAAGGAISAAISTHTFDVFNSKFELNSATNGGVINSFGTLTIDRSVFDSNTASSNGGVLYHTSVAATVNITRSTFSGNASGGGANGGGVFYPYGGGANTSTYNFTGNLFSGNSSVGGAGGVIYYIATATLNFQDNTFFNNSADYGGAYCDNIGGATVSMTGNTFDSNSATTEGGAIWAGAVGITFKNNIIANNTAPAFDNCASLFIVSAGTNISDNNDCFLNASGDLPNRTLAEIDLQALADNGGPTQTMRIPLSSMALDAGDNVGVSTTDQRVFSRTVDADNDGTATTDIGAFEVQ